MNPAQRSVHARKLPLHEPVLPGVCESDYRTLEGKGMMRLVFCQTTLRINLDSVGENVCCPAKIRTQGLPGVASPSTDYCVPITLDLPVLLCDR
jgi:hypothetical protein